MFDGPTSSTAQTWRIFLIEVDDVYDALTRVLLPFAFVQAQIEALAFASDDGVAQVRVEVSNLCGDRAALVQRRLSGLPVVRDVSLGWREVAAAIDRRAL